MFFNPPDLAYKTYQKINKDIYDRIVDYLRDPLWEQKKFVKQHNLGINYFICRQPMSLPVHDVLTHIDDMILFKIEEPTI